MFLIIIFFYTYLLIDLIVKKFNRNVGFILLNIKFSFFKNVLFN